MIQTDSASDRIPPEPPHCPDCRPHRPSAPPAAAARGPWPPSPAAPSDRCGGREKTPMKNTSVGWSPLLFLVFLFSGDRFLLKTRIGKCCCFLFFSSDGFLLKTRIWKINHSLKQMEENVQPPPAGVRRPALWPAEVDRGADSPFSRMPF